ncbi:MAG: hypothetical protein N2544_08790 [Burkholderiales bacterium]|nr:hypothetical protein [Burkholderiales bacterium]
MKLDPNYLEPHKIEAIDRVSLALLRQVELQIEAAENLTRLMPPAERKAILDRLEATRRDLERFRAERLGASGESHR